MILVLNKNFIYLQVVHIGIITYCERCFRLSPSENLDNFQTQGKGCRHSISFDYVESSKLLTNIVGVWGTIDSFWVRLCPKKKRLVRKGYNSSRSDQRERSPEDGYTNLAKLYVHHIKRSRLKWPASSSVRDVTTSSGDRPRLWTSRLHL